MTTGPAIFGSDQDRIQATVRRAMALHQEGQLDEAERLYKSILAASPDHFEALHYFGLLEAQRDHHEAADQLMRRSLEINTGVAVAFANHARVLNALKRSEEAIAACDKALSLNRRLVEAMVSRGIALKDLERYQEALASLDRALIAKPGYAAAQRNRANVLLALGRHADAVRSCDGILKADANDVMALVCRGHALKALHRLAEALASFERSLALSPNDIEVLSECGVILHLLNRNEEALVYCDRALAMDRFWTEANAQRAVALQMLGRHEESLLSIRRARAVRPDDKTLAFNESYGHFGLGRLAEGWECYETRFEADPTLPFRAYPRPRWDGGRVAGTLLIWGEQGLGDQILYANMIPDVMGLADEIVLEVEPRLVALFARSFAGARVVAIGNEPYRGRVDVHVPIGSLGRHLRPDLQAFPKRETPLFVADQHRAARLRARLHQDDRKVIGLSWRSRNPKHEDAKTAQLTDFAALLRQPRCRFIDLQYGDTAQERKAVERALGVRVERLDDIDNTKDIDGLAALISACDAVASVSNTTVHLAGSLGCPTWVFLPHGNGRMWYWFENREDSPWYASVCLKRQTIGQPWSDLIKLHVDDVLAAPG
jgi:tetratricopeptide (TPR) repeat protein